MAWWKRTPTVVNYSEQPSAKDMLIELKEELQKSRASTERVSDNMRDLVRSNNDLTKALNAATREFKKTRS